MALVQAGISNRTLALPSEDHSAQVGAIGISTPRSGPIRVTDEQRDGPKQRRISHSVATVHPASPFFAEIAPP